MKLLIFSWRDLKHPKSGGAEILTIELAKRWVKAGHQVTLVSAKFPGANDQETISGVGIIRPARFYRHSPWNYLPYLYHTASFYRKYLVGRYDLVIDQVHGLPFFAPFYVKERVILFPLEVAGKIWFREVTFPFSLIGFLLERIYIRLFRTYPFLIISPSTSRELTKLGIRKLFNFSPGLNFTPKRKLPSKSPVPLLVSLARITEMKRIEETLQAFRLLHKEFPLIKLFIIGRGKKLYIRKLKRLCLQTAIEDRVFFPGYVSEKEKIRYLSQAWMLVSSSVKEGWGLTVIEAAACGTPTVAYRIPGLVDSIKNNQTGLLCQRNTPVELARMIRKVLLNPRLRNRLSQNALAYSRQFSWDKAADECLKFFAKI